MLPCIAVDLLVGGIARRHVEHAILLREGAVVGLHRGEAVGHGRRQVARFAGVGADVVEPPPAVADRSEEHTSELQSLMRTSYAVFCLKKKSNMRTKDCKKN